MSLDDVSRTKRSVSAWTYIIGTVFVRARFPLMSQSKTARTRPGQNVWTHAPQCTAELRLGTTWRIRSDEEPFER